MGTGGKLQLEEGTAGGTFVGFKAPDTEITNDLIWTLPNVDGTSGQVMSTDGAKNIQWFDAAPLSEVSARISADASLQQQVDTLIGGSGFGFTPIGGMIVVMPNIDAVNAWQPPASSTIKDGFMRADGTTINAGHVSSGCKLAVGTVLPNMIQKYPKGNTTSGSTGGANTVTITSANLPTHTHGTGTLANAAEAAHTHTKSGGVSAEGAHYHASVALSGTLVNEAELAHTHESALPAHRHFIRSRSTSTDGSHSHGSPAFWAGGDNAHRGGTYTASQANGAADSPWYLPADGSHAHSWGGSWSNESSSVVAGPDGDGSGNTYQDGVGYWGVNGTRTTSVGSSHNHGISGHTGSVCAANGTTAATHTHADTIAYGAGSSHNHTISGSTSDGGFANTALNNEPAHVEVIWVIRVS
jgi:hypothetical protein